ncbi:hypothetical protein EDD15DRAFT_2358148 [Pisolithus albus]|nr:hypothetical protein EDD15DRAFT_2358148 [Pisolithus albus]
MSKAGHDASWTLFNCMMASTSPPSPTVGADQAVLRQEQDNVEYLLMLLPRLLEMYCEFQNPASHRALECTRTPTTVTAPIPVTSPPRISYDTGVNQMLTAPFSSIKNLVKLRGG